MLIKKLEGKNRTTIVLGQAPPSGHHITWHNYFQWFILPIKGTNRSTIVHGHAPHPLGITLYRDDVFWADLQQKTIERAHKYSGMNRTTMHTNVENVVDILIFHDSRQAGMVKKFLSFTLEIMNCVLQEVIPALGAQFCWALAACILLHMW